MVGKGKKFEPRLVTEDGQLYSRVRPRLKPTVSPHADVEQFIRGEHGRMFDREVAAGIQKEANRRPDYMEHELARNLDPVIREAFQKDADNFESVVRNRVPGARKFGANMGRALEGSAHEVNQRLGFDLFETDAARLVGHRTRTHKERMGQREWADDIALTGISKPSKAQLDDVAEGHAIYRRSATDRYTEIRRRDIKKGDDVYILPELNTNRAIKEMEHPGRKTNAFLKVQGAWKGLVTIGNPSYWVGNEFGNRIMAWQGDVGIRSWRRSQKMLDAWVTRNNWAKSPERARGVKLEDYAKRSKTLGRVGKDEHMFMIREVELAEKHGALSVGQRQELDALTGRRGGNLRNASDRRENHTRMMSWIEARAQGMTPERASRWVNKHHIDYNDLTPFEHKLPTTGSRFTPSGRATLGSRPRSS